MPTIITVTLYDVSELQELPTASAFHRAHDQYAWQESYNADFSEDWASLAALDATIGYERDYRSRPLHRGLGDCANLTGRRALAWYENTVVGPLRLPWTRMSAQGHAGQERRRHASAGERPGTVPSCPLTGYYMDDVLLGALRDLLSGGMSVGDAMLALSAELQRAVDEETRYRTTEEAFIERATDEGWLFTAAGDRHDP